MIKPSLLITSLSFCASLAFANPIGDINIMNQDTSQKEITKESLNEMIGDLKQGVALGDINSMFYLGFLYFNGATLKDGTLIKADKTQGLNLLFRAISLGSINALSVLTQKSLEESDILTLTQAVKVAQNSNNIDLEDKDYYSMMLASTVLDKNIQEADSIEVATKWLYEAEKKRPNAKMQYILASMYAKLGNQNAADYYLNKSCIDPTMESVCSQYKSNNSDSSSDAKTCPNF